MMCMNRQQTVDMYEINTKDLIFLSYLERKQPDKKIF